MEEYNKRQARHLSIPTIYDESFIPEVGETFKGKEIIDLFQTRNWNMAIVLFSDGKLACACFERSSSTITGRSNLYLMELDEIPESSVNYWISKYYYLDGNMKEMPRAKLRFSKVKAKWEGKLYLARDSSKRNYVIIVRDNE